MARACSPPKTQSVKGYWRARPKRRRRAGRKTPETYYVAETASGHTCSHHHRTTGGAQRCANALNKRYYGSTRATKTNYAVERQGKKGRFAQWLSE